MSLTNSFILIRYSALGDVALCLPLLKQLAQTYPHYQFYFVTKTAYVSVFAVLPDNVQVIGMQTQTESLWSFAKRLRKNLNSGVKVIDLHNVLRSRILSIYLRFWGLRTVARLRKNRNLRRKFLQSKGRCPQQLPSVWERYRETCRISGLELTAINPQLLQYQKSFIQKYGGLSALPKFWQNYAQNPFFIIAPFASHTTKIYPQRQMQVVISLCLQAKISVLLVGKSISEETKIRTYIKDFASEYLQTTIDNPLLLAQEIFLFSYAKGALVMDSANLHLCGIANIPIISIWGATSPNAGFNVWPRTKTLYTTPDCWPCAIYGEKPCSKTSEPLVCLKKLPVCQIWNEIKNIFS